MFLEIRRPHCRNATRSPYFFPLFSALLRFTRAEAPPLAGSRAAGSAQGSPDHLFARRHSLAGVRMEVRGRRNDGILGFSGLGASVV